MRYREVASAIAGAEEPGHEESRLPALCSLPMFSSFSFFAPSRLRVKNSRSCYITVFNPFGFPAPEVIERYAARNIPMYRTDANGAVHAVSDGRKWTIGSEQ